MLTLGIDPGTATLGYGIICENGKGIELIDYGCIRTSKNAQPALRLKKIHTELKKLIQKNRPDQIAVEELFFQVNVKTALSVGQARGVVLLACADCKVPVAEYTPLQVKQAITGYGRAEKKQVQYMVKNLLKLDTLPQPDDAADALAVAICHVHSRKINDCLSRRNFSV